MKSALCFADDQVRQAFSKYPLRPKETYFW